MTHAAAVFALAALAALPQGAGPGGYGETTWGMSLAQVRNVHPSGTVGRTPLGLTVYRVSGPVEPVGRALLEFLFGDDQLVSVDVRIPAPGTEVDLEAGTFVSPTDEQAREIWAALRDGLGKRFGRSSGQGGSLSVEGQTLEPANLYWNVPGTAIRLTRERHADGRTDVTWSHVDAQWMTVPGASSPRRGRTSSVHAGDGARSLAGPGASRGDGSLDVHGPIQR